MEAKLKYDYQAVLKSVIEGNNSKFDQMPLIVIDECVNHPKITETIITLCNRNLAWGADPLWNEHRTREDGSIFYVWGGLQRNHSFSSDRGVQTKYISWDDQKIVYTLIGKFYGAAKIVLLTENWKNDEHGLRRLLTNQVAPVLETYHQNKFSLTVLVKKNKTSFPDYCNHVIQTFEHGIFNYGYAVEKL